MIKTMPDWSVEDEYFAGGYTVIAGTDEAGRGPLAGSVYAAACVLPRGVELPGLNDSKKLTEKARERLFCEITRCALSYAVAFATPAEIDELNILNASQLAMRRAVSMLDPAPELVLVDGNIAREFPIPTVTLIGGDGKSNSIAAASVLAKVSRDRYCLELDRLYPGYGFALHKGYPTVAHYSAIRRLGAIPGIHRSSFRLFDENDSSFDA
jgi:Ribonuclease HII